MPNKSPTQESQRTTSNLPLTQDDLCQVSEGKVRYFCVDRFSEREISRQLAALCNLLILALARDFGIYSPSSITIVPSEPTRGVELRLTGCD